MHSSVISSVTLISRENPIYLLNEQLEISPFTLAKEAIDEQLQLDEDGSCGSGLLTYGSMRLLWLLRQMVLAGGEEHLMYDADSIRKSVKDLVFPPSAQGKSKRL